VSDEVSGGDEEMSAEMIALAVCSILTALVVIVVVATILLLQLKRLGVVFKDRRRVAPPGADPETTSMIVTQPENPDNDKPTAGQLAVTPVKRPVTNYTQC